MRIANPYQLGPRLDSTLDSTGLHPIILKVGQIQVLLQCMLPTIHKVLVTPVFVVASLD